MERSNKKSGPFKGSIVRLSKKGVNHVIDKRYKGIIITKCGITRRRHLDMGHNGTKMCERCSPDWYKKPEEG